MHGASIMNRTCGSVVWPSYTFTVLAAASFSPGNRCHGRLQTRQGCEHEGDGTVSLRVVDRLSRSLGRSFAVSSIIEVCCRRPPESCEHGATCMAPQAVLQCPTAPMKDVRSSSSPNPGLWMYCDARPELCLLTAPQVLHCQAEQKPRGS